MSEPTYNHTREDSPLTPCEVCARAMLTDVAEGVEKIRRRLQELEEIETAYLAYLQWRIRERDWHGGWDACVNLSEVSNERDGLHLALRALGEEP